MGTLWAPKLLSQVEKKTEMSILALITGNLEPPIYLPGESEVNQVYREPLRPRVEQGTLELHHHYLCIKSYFIKMNFKKEIQGNLMVDALLSS